MNKNSLFLYQNPMENDSSSSVREFKWFLAQPVLFVFYPLSCPVSSYIISMEGVDNHKYRIKTKKQTQRIFP